MIYFVLLLSIREMLKLGSSKSWSDAMELLTGQREMDAGPLLNYFSPLYEWLKNENQKTGEHLGWEATKKGNFYVINIIYLLPT